MLKLNSNNGRGLLAKNSFLTGSIQNTTRYSFKGEVKYYFNNELIYLDLLII